MKIADRVVIMINGQIVFDGLLVARTLSPTCKWCRCKARGAEAISREIASSRRSSQ
jgi:hypothetical protein